MSSMCKLERWVALHAPARVQTQDEIHSNGLVECFAALVVDVLQFNVVNPFDALWERLVSLPCMADTMVSPRAENNQLEMFIQELKSVVEIKESNGKWGLYFEGESVLLQNVSSAGLEENAQEMRYQNPGDQPAERLDDSNDGLASTSEISVEEVAGDEEAEDRSVWSRAMSGVKLTHILQQQRLKERRAQQKLQRLVAAFAGATVDDALRMLADEPSLTGKRLGWVDGLGWTALHHAVYRSHDLSHPDIKDLRLLRALLARNAPVDASTREAITPLHLAAMLGRIQVCNWLIFCGADATLIDNLGRTAADCVPLGLPQCDQVEEYLAQAQHDCEMRDARGKKLWRHILGTVRRPVVAGLLSLISKTAVLILVQLAFDAHLDLRNHVYAYFSSVKLPQLATLLGVSAFSVTGLFGMLASLLSSVPGVGLIGSTIAFGLSGFLAVEHLAGICGQLFLSAADVILDVLPSFIVARVATVAFFVLGESDRAGSVTRRQHRDTSLFVAVVFLLSLLGTVFINGFVWRILHWLLMDNAPFPPTLFDFTLWRELLVPSYSHMIGGAHLTASITLTLLVVGFLCAGPKHLTAGTLEAVPHELDALKRRRARSTALRSHTNPAVGFELQRGAKSTS